MNGSVNPEPGESPGTVLDPPAFEPPPEMRENYLQRRRNEVGPILDSARAGEWNEVVSIANHIRGTGAMYGFANIGNAAEDLVRAIQNGDADSLGYAEAYARAVGESYA